MGREIPPEPIQFNIADEAMETKRKEPG